MCVKVRMQHGTLKMVIDQINESETYPYRVFGSGLYNSVMLNMSITVDNSFRLCHYVIGFLIALHMPDELVDVYKNNIFLPPEQLDFITIKPKVKSISNDLRSYEPQVRGCYYRTERQLRFFKSYSQQKCELECLANYTTKECGCVQFDKPSN